MPSSVSTIASGSSWTCSSPSSTWSWSGSSHSSAATPSWSKLPRNGNKIRHEQPTPSLKNFFLKQEKCEWNKNRKMFLIVKCLPCVSFYFCCVLQVLSISLFNILNAIMHFITASSHWIFRSRSLHKKFSIFFRNNFIKMKKKRSIESKFSWIKTFMLIYRFIYDNVHAHNK